MGGVEKHFKTQCEGIWSVSVLLCGTACAVMYVSSVLYFHKYNVDASSGSPFKQQAFIVCVCVTVTVSDVI